MNRFVISLLCLCITVFCFGQKKKGEAAEIPPHADSSDGRENYKMLSDCHSSTDHGFHFRAPREPGILPDICTFPGDWMAMQTVLELR